jgi:hypothetical protein
MDYFISLLGDQGAKLLNVSQALVSEIRIIEQGIMASLTQ